MIYFVTVCHMILWKSVDRLFFMTTWKILISWCMLDKFRRVGQDVIIGMCRGGDLIKKVLLRTTLII